MNKNIAKEWINALRSGEYKQGGSVLYDFRSKRHCCLGVLNNLRGCPESANNCLKNTYHTLKLRDEWGSLEIADSFYECISLAMLNDKGIPCNNVYNVAKEFSGMRFNFDEIADVIQLEYIEGV